jgi:DNA-binding HxlR family transcriptional regulator
MGNNGGMDESGRRSGGDVATEHEPITAFCPVYHRAVELIGRRWTGVILRALISGATRFSDITAAVPGLSDRLLSERLKELEAEGIVSRTVYPTTPVRVEYGLTAKGLALHEVIASISGWAETWLTKTEAPDECRRDPEATKR